MPRLAKIKRDFEPPEAPPALSTSDLPAAIGWRNRRRIYIPAPWLPFLFHLSSPIPKKLEQKPRLPALGNLRC